MICMYNEPQEAFEFLECFWHGCGSCQLQDEINPVNGKTFQELHQKTKEKIKLLEEYGFHVRFIWECQWKRLSLKREIISFTQTLKSV